VQNADAELLDPTTDVPLIKATRRIFFVFVPIMRMQAP
jgi:hypothetical protein